jgi:hypothetical protein
MTISKQDLNLKPIFLKQYQSECLDVEKSEARIERDFKIWLMGFHESTNASQRILDLALNSGNGTYKP